MLTAGVMVVLSPVGCTARTEVTFSFESSHQNVQDFFIGKMKDMERLVGRVFCVQPLCNCEVLCPASL